MSEEKPAGTVEDIEADPELFAIVLKACDELPLAAAFRITFKVVAAMKAQQGKVRAR